jgi:hypothetical protein
VRGIVRSGRRAIVAAACAVLAGGTIASEPTADEAALLLNAVRQQVAACGASGAATAATAAPLTAGVAGTGPSAVGLPAPAGRGVLSWNPRLAAAAEQHARAMAEQGFFAHTDPQGRGVAQRASAAGYPWRMVGENLAAGQRTLEEAVRGWLLSDAHCRNLLDDRFVEFGLARVAAARPGDRHRVYWALVLGRPSGAVQSASLDAAAIRAARDAAAAVDTVAAAR